MSRFKVVKNTIYFSLGQIIAKSITIILLPLYTRYMGVSDFGIFSIAITLYYILNIVMRAGAPTSFFKEYFEKEDEESRRKLIGMTYIYVISVNIATIFIMLFLAKFMSSVLNINNTYIVILAVLTSSLESLTYVPMSVLRADQRAVLYGTFSILGTVVVVVFSLIFMVFMKMGMFGAFYAMIISKIVVFLFATLVISKRIKLYIDKRLFVEFTVIGWPVVFSGIAIWIISMSDKMLIGNLTNAYNVGIYSFANKIASLMQYLFYIPFSLIWGSESMRLYYKNDPQIFSKYFYRIAGLAFLVGSSITLWSRELILFSGTKEYLHGIYLIPVMVLSFIIDLLYYFHNFYPTVQRKTYIITFTVLIGAGLNVILNFINITNFGYEYAVFSNAISYCVVFSIIYFYMRKNFKFDHRWIRVSMFVLFYAVISLCGIYMKSGISNILLKMFLWVFAIFFYIRYTDLTSMSGSVFKAGYNKLIRLLRPAGR